MEVPRLRLGSAWHGHPEGWKLPSRTEHHIRFFFLHNNPQNLVYFKVLHNFLSLGENTWVRCNFITQAKSVAISVWCARKHFLNFHIPIWLYTQSSYINKFIFYNLSTTLKRSYFFSRDLTSFSGLID